MFHQGPTFLISSDDVRHEPPSHRDETALLASSYLKTARAAERARRWLLAQKCRDEARRLLKL